MRRSLAGSSLEQSVERTADTNMFLAATLLTIARVWAVNAGYVRPWTIQRRVLEGSLVEKTAG